MPDEVLNAERRIAARANQIFDVLRDPTKHADIDGTGWVCDPLDTELLTQTGQRFRMAMHHEQHPEKDYEMTNEVIEFDSPRAIAWRPGQPDENGDAQFGGWFWGYQLAELDAHTTVVTLTYDWSAATPEVRGFIHFPPFGPDHLDNSLSHLDDLVNAHRTD